MATTPKKFNLRAWKKAKITDKEIEQLMDWLEKNHHKKLGYGATRTTFAHGKNRVVKVPICSGHHENNRREYSAYLRSLKTSQNPRGVRVAKCYPGYLKGVPVLFMERVKPLATPCAKMKGFDKKTRGLPWVHYLDCAQVGETKSGEIVAFDAGNVYKDDIIWYRP